MQEVAKRPVQVSMKAVSTQAFVNYGGGIFAASRCNYPAGKPSGCPIVGKRVCSGGRGCLGGRRRSMRAIHLHGEGNAAGSARRFDGLLSLHSDLAQTDRPVWTMLWL